MFEPGAVVVYHHRVCEIASVREAYFEGRDYYELHALFENRLKLFVAVDDQTAGLRPVIGRNDALALIDAMADIDPIDEEAVTAGATATLRDRRIKDEYERLFRDGSPEDLVPIIKSIHQHAATREKTGRHLTAVDKKYADLAESALCDELSVALGIDRDDVADFIEQRLGSEA